MKKIILCLSLILLIQQSVQEEQKEQEELVADPVEDPVLESEGEEILPTVLEFQDKYFRLMFGQNRLTFLLLQTDPEQSQEARQQFDQAALSHKDSEGKTLFAVSTGIDVYGHYDSITRFLNVNKTQTPAVVLIDASTRFQYNLMDTITQENILEFLDKFTKGQLKRFRLSEGIPVEPWVPGTVKRIVTDTWNQEILESDKLIFLTICRDELPSCVGWLEIQNTVAKELEHQTDIVIAYIDLSKNEFDGQESISIHPELRIYPADDKKAHYQYTSYRHAEGIIEWLKETYPYHFGNEPVPEQPVPVPESEPANVERQDL